MIYLMLPGGGRVACTIQHMLPEFDSYCTDPAQHLMTEAFDLGEDDLDRDLPYVCKIHQSYCRLPRKLPLG